MRRAFRVMRDLTGNLPGLPAVFPDTMAPIVRTARVGERELTMMRWSFPPPPNLGTAPVTNVRNLKSPYWRNWLKAEWRCLVPATSFAEWTDTRPKVTKAALCLPSRAYGGLNRRPKGRDRRAAAEGQEKSIITGGGDNSFYPLLASQQTPGFAWAGH
jgi:hypothetical protein